MRLAAGMERRPFASPDAAIRSVIVSPLDARGIDYGHVGAGTSGPWQFQARLDRDATVRAILAQFGRDRQKVLVAYAYKIPCVRVAEWVGKSERTVRRWYQEDRRAFADRLQAVGLLEG